MPDLTSTIVRSTLCIALALAGCSESAPSEPPGEIQRSALERERSPAVSEAMQEALRRGSTEFALELHRRVSDAGENSVIGPHSIQVAFGMLRPGALGTTAEEIDETLGWALGAEELLPALNRLDLELEARNREGLTLAIANQAWAQTGYPFEPSYLDAIALHFGAGVALWRFDTDAEGGRLAINDWVSARTSDQIPELLPAGSVESDTKLVLVNAVHFDGAWEHAFDPSQTADGTFTREDGSQVSVPLMNATFDEVLFTQSAELEAVELPYAGGELAMLLIQPSGALAELEAALDADALDAIVSSLAPTSSLPVTMPRFELDTDVDLAETLPEMGMRRVFIEEEAELDGISAGQNLYVSGAFHAAAIEVGESGTKASAATGIVVGERSAAAASLRLDSPFLFLIRDRSTGAILFLGRIADPSKG